MDKHISQIRYHSYVTDTAINTGYFLEIWLNLTLTRRLTPLVTESESSLTPIYMNIPTVISDVGLSSVIGV